MNPRIDELGWRLREQFRPPSASGRSGWQMTIKQERGFCSVYLYQPSTHTEHEFEIPDDEPAPTAIARAIETLRREATTA